MIKEIEPGYLYYEFELPNRGDTNFLNNKNSLTSRALLTIGSAIFEFERYLKTDKQSRLDIAIDKFWPDTITKKEIEICLERFISYVLLSDTKVRLVKKEFPDDGYINEKEVASVDSVCLFSGGVDSISGVLAQSKHEKIFSVFCSHSHQARIVSLVRGFGDNILKRKNIPLYEIAAPAIDTTGYAQSRGFLYILSAASVANAYAINKVVVSECGPTMFQPKFSPADQVTMTTHPFVIERVSELIKLLKLNISIDCPYENRTKAEVMALCPYPILISKSHSCISQRLITHDGTCYGCVIRRLASLASNIRDTDYAKNPIIDNSANSGNLLSVLDFCADYLIDRQNMPMYQIDLIDQYNKWDLFERFALDNFSALYRIKRRENLIPAVGRIYERVRKHFNGTKIFRDRLQLLKSMKGVA